MIHSALTVAKNVSVCCTKQVKQFYYCLDCWQFRRVRRLT